MTKKPANREDFIRQLSGAIFRYSEKEGRKPTVAGTARHLKIHRDTLYQWMKEFNVDFNQISKETRMSMKSIIKNGLF